VNDVILFGVGCLVTLIVASAVGLLLWGASREPQGDLFPDRKAGNPEPRVPSEPPTAASREGLIAGKRRAESLA